MTVKQTLVKKIQCSWRITQNKLHSGWYWVWRPKRRLLFFDLPVPNLELITRLLKNGPVHNNLPGRFCQRIIGVIICLVRDHSVHCPSIYRISLNALHRGFASDRYGVFPTVIRREQTKDVAKNTGTKIWIKYIEYFSDMRKVAEDVSNLDSPLTRIAQIKWSKNGQKMNSLFGWLLIFLCDFVVHPRKITLISCLCLSTTK